MNLDDLLNAATGTDAAGEQRVQAIADQIRGSTGDLDLPDLETTLADQITTSAVTAETDEQVDHIELLADVLDAVRGIRAEQQQQQAARSDRVAELRSRAETSTATDADSGVTSDDAPEDDASGDATGGSTPEPGTGASTSPESGQDTAQEEKEPVAASAAPARRQSTASALAAGQQAMNNPAPETASPYCRYTITASAEVPDVPHGKSLTMPEVAEAALARYATFPEGQPTAGPMNASVARINRTFTADASLTGEHADIDRIDQIANEARLPGGSLVAAAGQRAVTAADQAPSVINDVWVSPSETDWTFCPPLATTDGMVDLPTMGMPKRGGLRYPVWQQYPDQPEDWHGTVIEYPENPAGTGLDNPEYFHQEANRKRCLTGPTVEWAEVRQSIEYLCVTSDILRDRTFPELTERFIRDLLVHHQHYMNSIYLSHILRKSDPITAFSVQNGAGSIGSSSFAVTDRLALLVAWFRDTYKMGRDATLELIAPTWFRDYLKRDLEKKQNRPYGSVSDSEVASIFAQYSTRVQWVQDWQSLPSGTAAGGFSGGLMPPDTWPTSVNIMAYPAGSWVLFRGNILNLGVQYDYQLLQENRYSAMFSEDAWMLLNRCNRSFVIQLTELCANGAVGPNRDSCAPAAATEPAA